MSACFWLLLVPTFDFIWLLLIDAIALATKLQLQLWWQSLAAPMCTECCRGDGWAMQCSMLSLCLSLCVPSSLISPCCWSWPLAFWKVFFPVIFQSHSQLLEFPPASLPTHLTAVVEGCLFGRRHTDVCLCCGVSLTHWHVQVDTCVSKRLGWSQLRKSPGTWIIYGFMQTDKHKW